MQTQLKLRLIKRQFNNFKSNRIKDNQNINKCMNKKLTPEQIKNRFKKFKKLIKYSKLK